MLLLWGLVLMHHTPGYAAHHGPSATMPTVAAGSDVTMTQSPAGYCPCPATAHQALPPVGSGHTDTNALLHLCLAILAALGILSLRLIFSRADQRAAISAGWRRGIDTLRPPLPVPRQLAVLGVLRL